jgi:putative membrane protein
MGETQTNQRAVLSSIFVVSAAAISFLLWLLYLHRAPSQFAGRFVFLPALNAVLNGLSAIALCTGLYFIKKRDRKAHRASMLLAFAFSSLFLVSYIVNHALHGDTRFPVGHATMVLITFFFSLSGRFPQHKRIARFTFPIWLYVSITGVVVFALLQAYAY